MNLETRRLAGRYAQLALCAVLVGCGLGGCRLFSNLPPCPSLVSDCTEGTAPIEIRFDARGSHDEDGIVTTYAWSFGDGTRAYGAVVTHVFSVPGTYYVELAISDDDGASAILGQLVVVREPFVPPTAAFSAAPSVAAIDEPVTFDASASFDPDGWLVSYSWDFGDASLAAGISAVHRFQEAGTFVVTLTVVDDDGASSSHIETIVIADTSKLQVPGLTDGRPCSALQCPLNP